MLGLCWAILGLCWAFVGSFGALPAAFGPKKNPDRKIFRSGFFLGRFWAYVGPFGGYVGPLLGHFRAMLGLCWVIWGSAGGFRTEKNTPNRIFFGWFFFWGVGFGLMLAHLEAMLGLCWAILRLCWTLLGLSGLKIQPQPTHGSVGVEFWAGFGLMLGHLLSRSRAMKRVRLSVLSGKYGKIWFYKLSFFWTHVGHLLCHFIFRFSTYPRHAGFNLLYLDFSFSERGVGTAFHLFTFFLLIP